MRGWREQRYSREAAALPRGTGGAPSARFLGPSLKVSGNGPGQSRPQSPLSPGTGPPSASRPRTAWSSAPRPNPKALGSSPKPSRSVDRPPDASRPPPAPSPLTCAPRVLRLLPPAASGTDPRPRPLPAPPRPAPFEPELLPSGPFSPPPRPPPVWRHFRLCQAARRLSGSRARAAPGASQSRERAPRMTTNSLRGLCGGVRLTVASGPAVSPRALCTLSPVPTRTLLGYLPAPGLGANRDSSATCPLQA